MSNQIDITGGARVRGLNGVITGTTGVLNSLPINSPNGIPQLDVNGKILVSQLPNSVMEFLGTWNAATNTPTLADGIGNAGDVYLCNVAGTVNFGSGPITFNDGDYVVYSGTTWERSGGAMGTVTSVAASITGNSIGITGSPITTAGTLAFAFAGTNLQYVNGAGNLTTFPTLITSIGLSMPTAFNVSNSPLTANGIISVTGAGTASQYIRGDGQLATFPTTGGGGSAIYYYLNGSIASSVAGYQQMSNTAIVGAGTDFALIGNGLISQFLTDIGNPNRNLIPSGAWNFEVFFSSSSNGGNEKFYLELVKYNGSTFTTIASTVTNPEAITGGTTTDLYITSMAVPETTLLVTDRLAIRVYIVDNSGARTITLHTEDNNLCQITTTFSAGISSINGLTENTQYFAVGTAGSDFNINSLVDTHTFNLPTASATKRGALSSADWTTFNSKVGGTGTSGQVAYWNGTSTQTGSNNLFWDSANNRLGIGTTTPSTSLDLGSATGTAGTINKIALYATIYGSYGFGVSPNQLDYISSNSHVFYNNNPTLVELFKIDSVGNLTSVSLVGTGTRMLVTNSAGVISTQAIPTIPVTSVFGRTGAVVAASGDYNTSQVTELTNLYFTDARARAAISLTTTGTSGAATYSNLTGVLNIPIYNSMVYPSAGIAVSTGTAWGTSLVDNSTNWNTAYSLRITSATAPLSISANVISIAQATTSTSGYLSSTDWNTFNSKMQGGGLTAGKVPFATGSASLGDTNLNYNGGFFGFGTAASTYRIDVSGDVNVTGNYYVNGVPIGSGGSISLAAIGSTPNANAATLTGSVLNLEPASASFGGVVTTGTQTFAGAKTFSSVITNAGSIYTTNDTPFSTQGSITRHSNIGLVLKGVTASTFDFAIYSASGNALITNPTGTNNINFSTGNVGISTLTSGSVLFAGTSGVLSQNNAGFNWNNTNQFLKLTSTGFTTKGLVLSGATWTANTYFGSFANIGYIYSNASYTSGWVLDDITLPSIGLEFGAGTAAAKIRYAAANSTTFSDLATFTNTAIVLTPSVGVATSTIGSKLQVFGNAAIGYSASYAVPMSLGLSVYAGATIGYQTAVTTSPANGLAVSGDTSLTGFVTTTSADKSVNIINDGAISGTRGLNIYQYNDGVQAASAAFYKSRGTYASPTNVVSGDLIAAFGFKARIGAVYPVDQSLFGACMTSTTGVSQFFITGTTAGNYAPSFLIAHTGNVSIGNLGGSIITTLTLPASKLQVVGNVAIGYTVATLAPASGLAVSGNVSIGTNPTSPTDNLEIRTASTTTMSIHSTGTGLTGRAAFTLARLVTSLETGWQFLKDENDDFLFRSLASGTPTERMKLASTGAATFSSNVGIGVTPSAWTTNPVIWQGLEINGRVSFIGAKSEYFNIISNAYRNNSSQYIYSTSAQAALYSQNEGRHEWSVAPSGTSGGVVTFTQAMTLNASSNLGVGTTTIGSKIQINGNAAIGYSTATSATSLTGLAVAGNVGIGNTGSATYALDVTGTTNTSNVFRSTNGFMNSYESYNAWELGKQFATTGLTVLTTQYVSVRINGTVYKLALVQEPTPP